MNITVTHQCSMVQCQEMCVNITVIHTGKPYLCQSLSSHSIPSCSISTNIFSELGSSQSSELIQMTVKLSRLFMLFAWFWNCQIILFQNVSQIFILYTKGTKVVNYLPFSLTRSTKTLEITTFSKSIPLSVATLSSCPFQCK